MGLRSWFRRMLGLPQKRRDYVAELREQASQEEERMKSIQAQEMSTDETLRIELDKIRHLLVEPNGDAPDA